MTTHHYVYSSYEEWGREYIGVRSCNCLPEEDTKYFGSFKDKSFKPTEKTILFVCETRKEAMKIEIELHDFFDVAVNPQFANQAKATSTRFDRTGVLESEETKKKKSVARTGENNPMYGKTGEKHPLFGVPNSEEQKKAQSERMSGVPKTKEHKKKLSEAMSGEKNPNYGKFGAAHCNSKAMIAIEPDGTQRHYGGIAEAARELKMDPGHLSTYLERGHVLTQGPRKGWQFLLKNP